MPDESTPAQSSDGVAQDGPDNAALTDPSHSAAASDATAGDESTGLVEQETIEAGGDPETMGFNEERAARLAQRSKEAKEEAGFSDEPQQDAAEDTDSAENTEQTENTDTFEINVYGQKRTVTRAELVDMAEKSAGADKKFMDAAEQQRQLDERERAIAQREAALSDSLPGNTDGNSNSESSAKSDGDSIPTQDAAAILERAILHDDDDAKQQVAQLLNRNTSTDVDAVAEAVMQKQQVQQEQQRQERWNAEVQAANAAALANEKYKEVMQDDDLLALANRHTDLLMEQQPGQSAEYYINSALDYVVQKFAPQGTVDPMSRRADAKRQHAQGVGGGRQSATALSQGQQAPQTTEDVISGMRSRRNV